MAEIFQEFEFDEVDLKLFRVIIHSKQEKIMTAAQYVEANLKTEMSEFYRNGVASGYTVQELRKAVLEHAIKVSVKQNGKTARLSRFDKYIDGTRNVSYQLHRTPYGIRRQTRRRIQGPVTMRTPGRRPDTHNIDPGATCPMAFAA